MTDLLERYSEVPEKTGLLPDWFDKTRLEDVDYYSWFDSDQVEQILEISERLLGLDNHEEYSDFDEFITAISGIAYDWEDSSTANLSYHRIVSSYVQLAYKGRSHDDAYSTFISDFLWWYPREYVEDDKQVQMIMDETFRKLVLRDARSVVEGVINVKNAGLIYSKSVLAKLLMPFGFTEEQSRSIWAAYNSHTEDLDGHNLMIDKLAEELHIISYIYERNPSILQELYKRFGIRNFSRYNPESLIAQCSSLPSDTDPRVLVLSSTDDWNNHAKGVVYFADKATDKITATTAFYEVISVLDIARAARDFAKDGRADYVIFVSHGDKDALQIKEGYDILLNHKRKRRLAGIIAKTCTKDNATLILTGCMADKNKHRGIAQQLRNATGLRVRAPEGIQAAHIIAGRNKSLSVRYVDVL